MIIKDLYVEVEGKEILKGINLNIKPGQRHVLMGPNASGKTTLSLTIMGFPEYKITRGEITFNGEVINDFSIDERARKGIALAFQSPPKVDINFSEFMEELKNKFNSRINFSVFKEEIENFKSRNLNDGLSGGEKKRSELVQVLALNPKIIILDEIDSGVDIDSLELIGKFLNEREESMLIVTHYRHILNYIRTDKIHLLSFGKIVVSDSPDKILYGIEHYGYKGYLKKLGICKECQLKKCVVTEKVLEKKRRK